MKADFQSQLKSLLELQEIDLKLYKDRTTLDLIPEQKRLLEEEHKNARAEFDSTKTQLGEFEHQKRVDEMELAASVEHLRNREAKLYAIKTNKEYQAAIKEISEAKRLNREREDRILQAMEQIEQLTQKTTQLESEIADKDMKFEKSVAELDARIRSIRDEMKTFEARRPDLIGQLEKEVLRRYDSIRRRYPDAVIAVANGVCTGCTMRIPPQLINEVMRGIDFKMCPSCHRMIYVEQKMETANEDAS